MTAVDATGIDPSVQADPLLRALGAAQPRYGTRRCWERPTLGSHVEAISMVMTGEPFMPHQRYIADVTHEIDPVTGLLYYELVVIVIPRQSGKTTLLEPTMIRRAQAGPDVDVVYTAQTRDMAKRRLIDDL